MKKIICILSVIIFCISGIIARVEKSEFLDQQNKVRNTQNKENEQEWLKIRGKSKGPFSGSSSSRNRSISINGYNSRNSFSGITENKALNDSAYYQNIARKNGWFVGIGPKISPDSISHFTSYYKFSRKNQAGNWTLVQAMNGFGELTTSNNFTPYILDKTDNKDAGANKDWKEKLQTVCQIDMIASPDGKEVVQERSLDALGNVIYGCIPTRTGRNTYLYTYIDTWGRPAYLRTDSLGNDLGFANFIEVTRDSAGYEILYKYTDRNGVPQKNHDGAFMTRREYDKDGNVLKIMSLNILGNRMIDDFGNCGMKYEYDTRGNMLSAMSYDAEWKPSVNRNLNRSSLTDLTCGYWWEYDEFGRNKRYGYLDTSGNKCPNQFGTFECKRKFDDHGLVTKFVSYDRDGGKCAVDSTGTAEIISITDDFGFVHSVEVFGADGKPLNSPDLDGICKHTWEIDKGTVVEENEFITVGDSIKKRFHYERDSLGNESRIWYINNLIRVDSVDERGNETLVAYYDLNHKPVDFNGFHRKETSYNYDNGRSLAITKWTDKNGEGTEEGENGYFQSAIITDSINNSEIIMQTLNDFVRYAYVVKKDENTGNIIAQNDVTASVEHARVGWLDMLYYKTKIERDYNDKLKSYIGENEFGEPGYISSTINNLIYHAQFLSGNGEYVRFDENGVKIPDDSMAVFRARLPKVFCLEITGQEIADSLGLKNNDIIIRYGDWSCDSSLNRDVDNFYLETILQTDKSKKATILRHHPELKSSEIIEIDLPEGKPSELGFYPHKIYYTQREKERLLAACDSAGIKLEQSSAGGSIPILVAVVEKGSLMESLFYFLPQYDVRDPAIMLYAKESYGTGRDTWTVLTDSVTKWENNNMLSPNTEIPTQIYMTDDLKNLKVIDKKIRGNGGLRLHPVNVTPAVFAAIEKIYNNNDSIIPKDADYIPDLYKTMVINTTEDGIFRDNNLNSTYILLQFNCWRAGMDYESLSEEIKKSRDKERALAFIEIHFNENSMYELGEFHNVTFPPKFLGIEIDEIYIPKELHDAAIAHLKKVKKYKSK